MGKYISNLLRKVITVMGRVGHAHAGYKTSD